MHISIAQMRPALPALVLGALSAGAAAADDLPTETRAVMSRE